MAVKAVDGALDRAHSDGGRAVLALVDAVDPAVDTSASLVVTADNVGDLSFAQLTMAVRSSHQDRKVARNPCVGSTPSRPLGP